MPEAPAINAPSVADEALAGVGRKILRLAEPTEAPVMGEPPAGKYCSVMHAELVRMKILGLSDQEAAQSAGISAETLRRWRVRHSKLNYDLDQAFDLSTAQAAAILRKLMEVAAWASRTPRPGCGASSAGPPRRPGTSWAGATGSGTRSLSFYAFS